MGHTNRLTAEAHLDQAVRHLGTAEVVMRHLDVATELSPADRRGLSDTVDAARARLESIAEELAGRGLEREFEALIADPTADRDHFH